MSTGQSSPQIANLDDEIVAFTNHIDSLRQTLPMTMMLIQAFRTNAVKRLTEFEKEECTVTVDGTARSVSIPIEHYSKWKKLKRRRDQGVLAGKLVPPSIFVSLVSQYDAFLGKILRIFLLAKPELLNASKRELSFADLVTFPSIDVAREFIIQKEIESILRMSHVEQFSWMENRFAVVLTKLDAWLRFVELTQRRNLFVHADGIVSNQYISECRKLGCPLESDLKEGDLVGVPQRYFDEASACIFEIGVKLAQVLWRKLIPDEIKKADENLNEIAFNLIDQREFELAIALLDFAVKLPRHSDESKRLTFVINLAQAYKWHGKTEACQSILDKEDWSAVGDEFKLAQAVLKDDWDNASRTMSRIGENGVIGKLEYRDWPLFKEFRDRPEFLENYSELFHEKFPDAVESQATNAPHEVIDGNEHGQIIGELDAN